MRQACVGAADRAERELHGTRHAVLAAGLELPAGGGFGEQPVHERVVAAEEQRRQGPAEHLAGPVAEEAFEGGVGVRHQARGRGRVDDGEREGAGPERRAGQRAVRKQAEKRRRRLGFRHFVENPHEPAFATIPGGQQVSISGDAPVCAPGRETGHAARRLRSESE